MNNIEVMKQARDVLMFFRYAPPAQRPAVIKAISDLEQALAAPVQEPLPQCTHNWVSNPKEKWCLRCGAQEADHIAGAGKLMPPAAPVQEPVAWGIIASNTGRICQVELDAAEVEGHNPKHIVPLYTTPPAAQPAVQDVKELFGYEIWNRFYRSKPELLDEMVRPNAGYPLDWIEANIREVYVHGTYALAEEGRT
jgi:hypothetical protein